MPKQCYQSFYPYLFLLGNCLLWYNNKANQNSILITMLLALLIVLVRFKQPAVLQYRYILCLTISGYLYSLFIFNSYHQWHFPEQAVAESHLLTGNIQGLPEHNNNIIRLKYRVSSINHQKFKPGRTILFRLTCYRDCPKFKADQSWQLLVRLKPVNGYVNPQGFDYEKWLFAEQIKATGYIILSAQNKLLSTNTSIDTIRQLIRKHFIENITDPIIKGSVIALSLGDKSYLSSEQQKILAKNGLSHLMAISGLHIGLSAIPGFLFAGFIWSKVRYFQRFNRIRFQWISCLIPALSYTALSGFGLPATRSLLMLIVFALVQLVRNSVSVHSRFCLALGIILITQPLAPLQLSFWLSFSATAMLIFLGRFHRPNNKLLALIQLQLQLFILLLPLQLLFFGSLSLLSPVINIIAIPFISLILLPLLLLLILLILISESLTNLAVTGYLLYLVEYLFMGFWQVLDYVAPLTELSQYSNRNFSFYYLLAYPLLVFILLVRPVLKLVIIICLFVLQMSPSDKSQFTMMVLDVGQGLAITINYQDKLMVYDTAYGSQGTAVAQMTLLPWLEQLVSKTIDLAVVSHNDADHAGGLNLLMNTYLIKQLLTGPDVKIPEDVSYQPVNMNVCAMGQQWQWQDLSIEVLAPEVNEQTLNKGNDSSCVLLVSLKGINILLTGDIEAAAEKKLLQNHKNLKTTVLLVPHHGSQTSSGWPLIEQLEPEVAIISSGYLNRFNLPAKVILQRYQKSNVELYNTAYSGAIELTINSHGVIRVKQWRMDNEKLWRRH